MDHSNPMFRDHVTFVTFMRHGAFRPGAASVTERHQSVAHADL